MVLEIEAQFININIKKIIKKIKENNGKCIHKPILFRRYMFSLFDPSKKGYMRIRDEGDGVRMTTKVYETGSKYANEAEIKLDCTLEEGRDFLIASGYKIKAYYETMREKWILDNAEVVFDTIPGIPTYMEIEASTEAKLQKIADKLDIDFNSAVIGGAHIQLFTNCYDMKREDIERLPSLTFENINNEIKDYIKKNKQLLSKIKKEQMLIVKKLKK